MINVFGRPYSDNGQAPLDGERFVTERVDPAFKNEIDSSKQRVEEIKKKGRMPTWKLFAGTVFAPVFAYLYLRIMNATGSINIFAGFSTMPLATAASLVCLVISVGTLVIFCRMNKKMLASPELAEANARLASLDKNSEIMLGLPQEYEKVDVLSFEYVEKDGKVRIKDTQPYRYLNSEMKLYKNGDMLCLADIERVYSFPIADIKK